MNCQDISQIIDSGNFTALTDAKRGEAEAHADSCRHCAPLWFAHSRLAATRVPPMPPELSVRCLTLAANSQPLAPRRASRRAMIMAGSLVVLAAAASMLVANLISSSPPPRPNSANALPPAVSPVAISEDAPEARAPAEETTRKQPANDGLPLLPAPIQADRERDARQYLALRKAVELYPQLTEGPELEDDQYYVVSIALRADGTVLSNAMEIATEENLLEVSARFIRSAMRDIGSGASTRSRKGAKTSGGRSFRGNVSLQFSVVPNDFDPSKSDGHVEDIVRARHADLLLPAGGESLNVLTVYLSDDGRIQNEHVELLRREEAMKLTRRGGADEAAGLASEIAGKLGLSADQIGLMGFTFITEDPKSASSQEGVFPPEQPRVLAIRYAWPRRAMEAAPTILQDLDGRYRGIDIKAAQVIVERLMPQAFRQRSESTESQDIQIRPTVVLTSEGEVIRTEYVKNTEMHLRMQKLEPGRVATSGASVSLTNSVGNTAEVQLVWQYTAAQKEEMEKHRFAAQSR